MKFYLCDDEKLVHETYREKIATLCKKHSIDCELFSYYSGEVMIADFDKQGGFSGVVFLDINMPKLNGITVAKKLQSYDARGQIIFLTMSRKHLLAAFDVRALNYIIKDATSDSRFEEVLVQAIEAVHDDEQEYMLFTCGGENISIDVKKIHYFEVIQRVMTVHYEGGSFDFVSTMRKIEEQLHGQGFLRVHRAYLVHLPYVASISYTELQLRDGTAIPVGRTYYSQLKNAFLDFSGAVNE